MASEEYDEIEQLAQKAKLGDRAAFSRIVRIMMSRIVSLTYRMTSDRESALDLAQDSFVAAWEQLAGFRGESRFSSWLFQIATNKCLNFLKKASTRQNVPLDDTTSATLTSGDPAANPERTLKIKLLKEDVLHFMQSLPDMQRLVFELRFYQGMPFSEIARQTGKAEGTVKTHYRQAVIKLREVATAKGWAP
ncbi:MAG: RNA polymerase sigma factor [candidate division Zixibacteria bacterium]|nr:RNA polymerase sigma factor [candidate division Zixibacteria bacterium]MDH3937110.1 RNA polymerase sigma factor [candidate division Zixibacteria bacterium]MDH4033037.1 RNA polymerase sigma factor [candidate division Zixibacteria bacterium]